MKIRVIHTINAFTATSGGTSTCTYDLLKALNMHNDVQADILVTKPKEPLMGQGEDWIISVENDEKTPFSISANLHKKMIQTEADIYHTNGLWRYCNHVPAAVARQKGKPFVLTPHGPAELLADDRGWLVPNGDIEALTAQIEYVIAHPEEADLKAKKAQTYAQNTYSEEAIMPRWIKEIEDASNI